MNRTAEIVSAEQLSFARALEMTHHRKVQFVDRMQWDLPYYDQSQFERDQFDTPDAHYMFFSDGEGDHFSMRVLHRDASMVADIWPDMLGHVLTNSLEISRFVSHGRSTPAHVFPFKETLESYDAPRIFAVATKAMLAVYSRYLKWKPDYKMEFPQYDGIFLVQWERNL